MKTNAIVRIIIFSIVILLLLGVLAMGLGIGSFIVDLDSFVDFGDYTTGSGSVSADEVEKLSIDWASGSIKLQAGDTDTITFTEEGSGVATYSMVYEVRSKTLSISFSKPALQIGFGSVPSKDLIITVPVDWVCIKLDIDAASTSADIENLTIQQIDLDSASNSFRFLNCTIGTLDVDGASNSIYLDGTLDRLSCDGMSTGISAVLSNVPEQIDLDGMSSELDVTLPADCGFRVTMEGLSNDFSSDFQVVSSGGSYVYGDGHCRIDVDGMSGKVTIRKGE